METNTKFPLTYTKYKKLLKMKLINVKEVVVRKEIAFYPLKLVFLKKHQSSNNKMLQIL